MRNYVDTTEKRNEWIEEKATSTATSQNTKSSLKRSATASCIILIV